MLILDGRKENPYHCGTCGDTKLPCPHWTQEEKNILMTWLNVHDLNTEVTFITWYEYEMKHQHPSEEGGWCSTRHHADTLDELTSRPPERKGFEFRVVRKTLTTEVI